MTVSISNPVLCYFFNKSCSDYVFKLVSKTT